MADALAALGLAPRYRLEQRPARSAGRIARKTLNAALDRLSGNRSTILTRKTGGGGFECVQQGPPIRAACVRVRGVLASGGFEAAIAAHDALLEEHGHSPLVYSHRGELRLWCGRYDEAAEDFEIALRLHRPTRWAWAGLGACHLLRGRPALALATFARGRLHVVPALTTHVYAAEAWHALGRHRRALSSFRTARSLHPRRASASLGLALTAACLGEARAVEEHFEGLAGIAPGFLRALLRDTGIPREQLLRDTKRACEVAERGFEMMRGNRSSGSPTWFDRAGRAYMEAG
jgi:tetratricopeptide (TPR) repeat protein